MLARKDCEDCGDCGRSAITTGQVRTSGWSKAKVWLAGIGSVTAFLGSAVGIAAAFGWLPPQGGGDSARHPETPKTVTALIESNNGGRIRGFFTAKGYLITYNVSFLGSGAMAAWTVSGETTRAPIKLVRRGGADSQAALLQVVGVAPPAVTARTRPVEDLKQGEPLRFPAGPEQAGTGEVINTSMQVPQFPLVEGGRKTLGLLVSTGMNLGEGDAGIGVTDSDGRLVGMMIARAGAQWYSVPISVLIAEFPEAF
jgi:hypothetical protein